MSKYVPLDKRSKKEQKEFHSMQRGTWEGVNPASKVMPSGKSYNRKSLKARDRKRNEDE